ncbi:hypothetical protein E2C01_036471 [Portunus trituberculatus]|uniref:Uncharacterized protein n=1 Tax=Portunus trituberculatus TaxID=210409 RepID=A0A5B7F5R1_PORTR|nr:hypothetical protein [Portunus trituberculatus]
MCEILQQDLEIDGIEQEATDLQHSFMRTNSSHGGPLHQHVAVCEQLQRLEGGAVGSHQPLPPLHKPILVAHHVSYLWLE